MADVPRENTTAENQTSLVLPALKASIDGLAILNSQEKYIFVNEAHAAIYGYENPSELIGQTWRQLYGPSERQRFETEIMPLFYQEGHWRGESIGLRKDGTYFPQEVSLAVTEEGGFVCAVRDISMRRQVEGRQALLTDLSQILSMPLDQGCNEILIRALQRITEDFADACLLTYKASDGLTRNVSTYGSVAMENDLKDRLPLLLDVIQDQSRLTEFSQEALDGWPPSSKGISIVRMPLQTRQQTFGTLLALRVLGKSNSFTLPDLSLFEVVASRAALLIDNNRLLTEASLAIQARDDLLAAVSHDLKNPISAISANADLMHRLAPSTDLQTHFGKIADNIHLSIQRMQALVKGLLALEKLRGGRYNLEPRFCSSAQLLAETREMFLPMATEKKINLQIDTSRPDVQIHCDYESIMRVFSNLLGNALKYTPANGTVTIGMDVESRMIRFFVKDTGIGLSEDQLEHIFDHYWQAKKAEGLEAGLGLSIAKGLVEAHNGKIWARSRIGQGTEIYFSLPMHF